MPESKVKTQKSKAPVKKVASVKSSAKTAVKPEVKTVSKSAGLSVPVYSLTGAKKGSIDLPKEIFGAKVNEPLLAQALRVYMVNQRQGTAMTKNRGEVTGSTRKIYRQKGTGRARHGAIKAPIFVGGGIAFGPRPRNFELKLSKQMKKKALISALSSKASENAVYVVDVTGATGKTKEVYKMFKTLTLDKKKILFVSDQEEATRGAKNIDMVTVEHAKNINTYEVLNNNSLVFSRESLNAFTDFVLKRGEAQVK